MKQVTAHNIACNEYQSLDLERAFDSKTCGLKATLYGIIYRANKAMMNVVNNCRI